MLMETQQDVFHITPHYRNFPSVLMRLSASDSAHVESMVRRRWRQLAPKKIRAEFDAATGTTPRPRRKAT